VLAEGEEEEEAERFYNQTSGYVNENVNKMLHGQATDDLDSLICIADAWFISMVVSMSLVCLMLSAFIVIWGCSALRQGAAGTEGKGATF